MAYLLASDFDRTLMMRPQWEITERNREAIKSFRDAGNIFAVVTGRTYQTAFEAFDKVGFHDMDCFCCLSGALCINPDGSEEYDIRVSGERLCEFAEFLESTGARYMNLDVGCKSYQVEIKSEAEYPYEKMKPCDLKKVVSFTSLNVGYHSEEEARKMSMEIGRLFGDMLTPLQNKIAIDLPPAGINKGVGVAKIAEQYGIEKDNIYTVGDHYNDMDMIKMFHGCAVENAIDDLKKAAEITVFDVAEVINMLH